MSFSGSERALEGIYIADTLSDAIHLVTSNRQWRFGKAPKVNFPN